MKHVIDTIYRQVNPVMVESEMNKIRDIHLDMRDIQVSIDSLKDHLNVWEKLNPFSQSDEKKELKYLRDELKFYNQELKVIKDRMRAEIRTIIEASPPLRMKATVSAMEDSMNTLRSRLRKSGNKQSSRFGKYAEMQAMQEHIRELDILLENQFGFEKGVFRQHEMVEAVLARITNVKTI